MSVASQEEGFVSRWSRRKSEVVEENQNEEILSEQEIAEEKLAKLNALTDEDMPDIETLGENSDYAGFMSINVSEGLRKIALQKLFHGKSYNIRDGLDEYDGDYTAFEKLDPSIITADMKHLLEVEAEKLLAKQEAEKADEEQKVALAESLDEELLTEESITKLETNLDFDSNSKKLDSEYQNSSEELT